MSRELKRALQVGVAGAVLVSAMFFLANLEYPLDYVIFMIGVLGLFSAFLFGGGLHGGTPAWYWIVAGTVINATVYALLIWTLLKLRIWLYQKFRRA